MSAPHAVEAQVRHYETLFTDPEPDPNGEGGVEATLRPDSLEVLESARLEPSIAEAAPGERIQLERLGYYCVDASRAGDRVVLHRTATLRDTWAKVAGKGAPKGGAQGGKK